MHRRLAEADPAAARILVDNGRRIVRALEVVEITGRSFSATLPELEYADPHTVQVGVDIDRPTLDERIRRRVDSMFAGGCVEEVEQLLEDGLREGRTAAGAIGYREVTAYFDGELSLDQARERTVVATRRFARRQDSWFRKDPRIVWVRYDDPQRVERALAAVGPWMNGPRLTTRSSRDTARRTTSCCCPTTTGTSTALWRRERVRGCATGAPASAPTACCEWCTAAGEGAAWFMDYRNADGSLSEMCGNGIRVFVRYLVDEGLVDPDCRSTSAPATATRRCCSRATRSPSTSARPGCFRRPR